MTYQWQIAPGYTTLRSGVTMTMHMCRALDTNGDLVTIPYASGLAVLYGFLVKVDGLAPTTGGATLTSGTLPAIPANAQIGGMPASSVAPSGTTMAMAYTLGTGHYAATTGGPGTGGGWIEPNQWYFSECPLAESGQPYSEEVWVAYDPWADYPNSATPPPTFP